MASATPRDPQPVPEGVENVSCPPGSLGEVVDWLVENDRQISALMARRAEFLTEESRRSATQADALSANPQSSNAPGRWNSRVIARRALISSVACALRLPERTAENLIETSRILVTRLSATHAALAPGAVNLRQAETIVDHATSLPSEAMAEFEAAALAIAPNLTNRQLDRRAGRIRESIHPESISARHTKALDLRCVDRTPTRDGMAWLSARLPAATATAAYNRITDLALNIEGKGVASTLTQLRADVFADLLVDGFTYDLADERATHAESAQSAVSTKSGKSAASPTSATSAGRGSDPTERSDRVASVGATRPVRSIRSGLGRGVQAIVHVTVPVMTLLGESGEPAELEGFGPIDDATARKLAAGAPSFHRILTHPETGAVLSVGRDSYVVPKDLRRWLVIRDETCRFPGCGRSARRSEVDHSLDWQYNGATVHDNLAHLCSAHHHLRHQTAWSYTQHAGGRLEWISPTGHRYATEPAVYFRNEIPDPDTSEEVNASLGPIHAVLARVRDASEASEADNDTASAGRADGDGDEMVIPIDPFPDDPFYTAFPFAS